MSTKIVKNSSYFSRYQTAFRRRRECKTDYVQRSSLIQQDKTKYGAQKYRLVARITNTRIIAQIVTATVNHDVTICQANSNELAEYGIKLGLTNYAAAYCVGLLLARRLLTKLGLQETFQGEIDEEEDMERRPFRVLLDVGLRRTTTGARVFGVMKGAVDGGLLVPHKTVRLPGAADAKKDKHHKEVDRNDKKVKKAAPAKAADKKSSKDAKHDTNYYILGQHVADYMRKLEKENPEAYKRQFGRYIAAGIKADAIKGLYENAHKQIRAKPEAKAPVKKEYKPKVAKTARLTKEQRLENLNKKLAAAGLPPHEINTQERIRRFNRKE